MMRDEKCDVHITHMAHVPMVRDDQLFKSAHLAPLSLVCTCADGAICVMCTKKIKVAHRRIMWHVAPSALAGKHNNGVR